MTVATLYATAPSSEITEWAAFFRIENEDRQGEQNRRDMAEWMDSF